MSSNEQDEVSEEELSEAILNSLKYLLNEGIIVREDDVYRLKTQEEIDKEINDILED